MAQFCDLQASIQFFLLFCFFAFQYTVNCASFQKNDKLEHIRSGDKEQQAAQLSLKHSGVSFQEAMNLCHRNSTCRGILLRLKTKCAVKAGKCNAKMIDLPACHEIMEKITETFFYPERKSDCEDEQHRCLQLYNSIYKNPCFVSVRFLRKKGMLFSPEKESPPSLPVHPKPKPSTESNDARKDGLSSAPTKTISVTMPTVRNVKKTDNEKKNENPPLNHNTFLSSHVTSDVTEFKESVINTSIDDVNFLILNPAQESNKNEMLLRVVAIVTGALVVVIIGIAAAVWFYFGLGKKANHVKTIAKI